MRIRSKNNVPIFPLFPEQVPILSVFSESIYTMAFFLFVFCFVFPDLHFRHLGVQPLKKNIFIYGSSLTIASQVKCFLMMMAVMKLHFYKVAPSTYFAGLPGGKHGANYNRIRKECTLPSASGAYPFFGK